MKRLAALMIFLAAVLAVPAHADNAGLDSMLAALLEAQTYPEQLALTAHWSEACAAQLEDMRGWDTDLNVPLAAGAPEEPPEGFFDGAVECDRLPEDMRCARWTAIYSDGGERYLAGNYLARLPVGLAAATVEETGCVFYIRHTRRAVEYTTGYGYGQEYAIYAFRADGSGDVYKLYGAYNPPPMAGIAGQIAGDLVPDERLFEGVRPFFSKRLEWDASDGVSLSFLVTGRGCCLEGYEGPLVHVTVPDSVAGYAVTGVAAEAFRDCESVRSVRLPDGVTWIGDDAFFGCGALEELNMPRSLRSVGASAFGGAGLRSLVFPEGLTRIGRCAINTMSRLEALSLPSTLSEMGEWNLESGSRVPRIVLPDGLAEIGDGFLFDGQAVRCVYIPGGARLLGNNILCGSSETAVYTPKGSPAWERAMEQGLRAVDCDAPEDMPDARYETDGDFRYIVFEGKACVTDYLGSETQIKIPSTLGGYPVTTITGCFSFSESVTDITVAEGVLTIKPYALSAGARGAG